MTSSPAGVPVLFEGATSAECVKSFFDLHIGEADSVIDLTYGSGTFWKWDWEERVNWLVRNDRHVEMFVNQCNDDFRATRWQSRHFDVVVFDPPFTANGPSKEGHQKRYGADRSMDGAPQNIHEVRSLLASGLIEAMRLSKKWVLVKTQNVIESGRLHDSEGLVRSLFLHFGFRIVDYRLYAAHRRAQPDEARGATPKHFRERPSVFFLAKRGAS